MKLSRRTRVSEKKIAARIIRLFLTTLGLGIIIFFLGPNLLVRFSLMLNPQQQIQTDENSKNDPYLFPPTLDPLATATNSSKINLYGNGQPGTKVRIRHNGQKQTDILVAKDGSFTVRSIKLEEGENFFTATTLSDGQESLESEKIQIIYKSEPPSLTITSPEQDSSFTGEHREINIIGETETDATVLINDRIIPVSGDGTFFSSFKLNEGDNNFTIKVQDIAGNETKEELHLTYTP